MDETSRQELKAFFSTHPVLHLHKGEAMLVQQQSKPDVFWLEQGAVRMYYIRDDGTEVTLHLFRPPAFFPMMLVLSRHKNEYYFEVVEDAIAHKAPADQVIQFLKEHPAILLDLTKRFADAIMGLSKRIEQLSSPQALERVARLLLYLMERYGRTHILGTLIETHLTHNDIAAWSGVVRETASHQVEKLTKEGIITTVNHQIVIIDPERLRQMQK